MSLICLSQGLSALNLFSRAWAVRGNNLANLRTTGFKASRVYSVELPGRSGNGLGVQLGSIQRDFSQGTLLSTHSSTDLAIDGEGFFIVDLDGQTFYSRAGHFRMDRDGHLVDQGGNVLQGWRLDAQGQISSALQGVDLSAVASAPAATSGIRLHVNLDARAAVFTGSGFDANDPHGASNHGTGLTVYDALGNTHSIDVYFRRESADTWRWYAVMDGAELQGGSAGPTIVAGGRLLFTDGKLDQEIIDTPFTVQFRGTTGPQTIDIDFGDSIATDLGSGLGGTTQFAQAFTTGSAQQDGYGPGGLISIRVNAGGVVRGLFQNGEERGIYRIALARFASPGSLGSIGANLFAETGRSGPPFIGAPGTSGLGTIHGGALESANVDLAAEFVVMIQTEHAFLANLRSIAAADRMLQELVDLRI